MLCFSIQQTGRTAPQTATCSVRQTLRPSFQRQGRTVGHFQRVCAAGLSMSHLSTIGLTAHATLTEAEGQQMRGDLVLAQAPQPTQGAACTAAQNTPATCGLSLYAMTHRTEAELFPNGVFKKAFDKPQPNKCVMHYAGRQAGPGEGREGECGHGFPGAEPSSRVRRGVAAKLKLLTSMRIAISGVQVISIAHRSADLIGTVSCCGVEIATHRTG
jgi:hypothetical protein